MCKVERRKITLPRFHSLDPVCFVFVRIILKRERGVLHSAGALESISADDGFALKSHGIHSICSQRKWIRRCTGQENMGNTEILIILYMWRWGTREFN